MNTDESETPVGLIKELKELRQRLVQAEASEKDLKREVGKAAYLASFLKLIPNPILELDQKGNIQYANPATIRLFPNLATLGTKHPFLADWTRVVRELQSNNWSKTVIRNIVVESLVYEQVLHPVAENQIRIYGRNITETEQELFNLNQIMNNLLEGVNFVRLSDLHIILTNHKLDEMFGYNSGELIGKHVSVLNAPGELTPEEIATSINRDLNKYHEWRGEIHNVRKDGSCFWCQTIVSKFIHPEYGEVAVSIHQDITERKQAEEALRESEEKFSKAFFASPCLMAITIQDESRIIEINDAFCDVLGYTREECLGRTTAELKIWADPQQRIQVVREINKNGYYHNFVAELRTKSGEIITVIYSIDSIILNNQKCLLSVATDITEQKKPKTEYVPILSTCAV